MQTLLKARHRFLPITSALSLSCRTPMIMNPRLAFSAQIKIKDYHLDESAYTVKKKIRMTREQLMETHPTEVAIPKARLMKKAHYHQLMTPESFLLFNLPEDVTEKMVWEFLPEKDSIISIEIIKDLNGKVRAINIGRITISCPCPL